MSKRKCPHCDSQDIGESRDPKYALAYITDVCNGCGHFDEQKWRDYHFKNQQNGVHPEWELDEYITGYAANIEHNADKLWKADTEARKADAHTALLDAANALRELTNAPA